MQPLFEARHHQRLQRGDDEQRVRAQRDGDVRGGPRLARDTRTRCGDAASGGSSAQTAATGRITAADAPAACAARRSATRRAPRDPRPATARCANDEVEAVGRDDRVVDRDRVQQRARAPAATVRRRCAAARGRRIAARPCAPRRSTA